MTRPRVRPSEPLWYKDAILYELHVRAYKDAAGDGMGDFTGLAEKLDYLQDLGITADLAAALLSLAAEGRRLRHRRLHRRAPRVRDHAGLPRLPEGGAPPRPPRHHRAGAEPHLRPASLVPARAAREARAAPPATSTCGATPRRSTRGRASSSRTSSTRTGPGTTRPRPTTGTASIRTSPTSTGTTRRSARPCCRCWTSGSTTWAWTACGWTRCPISSSARAPTTRTCPRPTPRSRRSGASSTSVTPTRCCSPRPTSGRRTPSPTSGRDRRRVPHRVPLPAHAAACSWASAPRTAIPIVDMLEQTPPIPANCQWVLFLRNHDELTLEMVTDEERDYMYRVYAQDQQARINVGIRRRLAPLLGNSRRKIELMNGLLFSLPGTPVLYYGDEIGMGDNFYLGRPERRAHADAVEPRPQRGLLAGELAEAVLAGDHRPRVPLRDDQRRGPAGQPRSHCCGGRSAS